MADLHIAPIPMPWLGQPGDTGQKFVQAAQAGAAVRQAWDQRRLLGLREKMFQVDAQMAQLKLDETERAIDLRARNTQAFSELSGMINEGIANRTIDDPAIGMRITGYLASNPTLMEDPRMIPLMDSFNKSMAVLQVHRRQQAELNARTTLGGPAKSVTDEQGRVIGYERPGVEGPRFIPAERSPTPSNLEKQVDFLRKQGVNVTKEQLLAAFEGSRTTIESFDPATGQLTSRISTGKGAKAANPEALTQANLTKVQDSQAQSLATIDVTNRLEPLISDETVGAKAFAESWIKDRILAQAFPEMASSTRANAEQLAAQLRATSVRELRSDSNITEGERKQILQAIPQINDPIDSPARARQLVQGIRKMSAIRAMVAAKRMGGDIPKSAAMAVDDQTIVSILKQGLITKEPAIRAYQLKREKSE